MAVPFEALQPQPYRLPNGVVLHAVRGGQGAPLVFIHGAMGDWRAWAPQWAVFTDRFDCVSYSRRYSHPNPNTMPSPHHSALDEASDLLALLDVLGWEKVVLVGSSYGGFTALCVALAQPDRVQALVCVEPPLMKYASLTPEGEAVAQAFRTAVIEPANAAFRRGDDALACRLMTQGIAGAGSQATQGPALQRRMQNLLAMKMLALSTDEFPWIEPDRLAALTAPVLLVAGQQTQPVHKAIFNNLSARMPQAQSVWVDGAGHSVSRDQPEVFNRLALDFLARSDQGCQVDTTLGVSSERAPASA
jgi:pimeloyl-ACP methyl ester carboxylesterase